jgi:hypothetical protein
MTTSSTRFVPSSDEYKAPERPIDRIRQITAKLPKVDAQGRALPRGEADPSVTDFVEPPSSDEPPTAAAGSLQPNAAQGVGGVPVPTPAAGGSTLERIAAELNRKLVPPIPEGFVPAPPR